jgi:alpha-acetolactate decarboxylase
MNRSVTEQLSYSEISYPFASQRASQHLTMANQLYQYSIISALMDGVASGGIALSKLKQHGNYGLGTFENIEGEMVMIAETVYHLRADGSISIAEPEARLPFAMTTRFQPTSTLTTAFPSKASIFSTLQRIFPGTDNLFIALRISALFQEIKVRTVRGQTYKGQPLEELSSSQSVNTYKNIRGTIFGFRSPPFSQGISVAGGHLHFVSEARDCGGHVLEVEAVEALLEGAVVSNMHIELPESRDFNEAKLEVRADGIGKIEG